MGSSGNYVTGNLFDSHDVVSVNGKGLTNLTFAYNSMSNYAGPLGRGWTHNYDAQILRTQSGLVFAEEDGKTTPFTDDGSGTYRSTGIFTTITVSGGEFILTKKEGTQYLFDIYSGQLFSIVDRNNNTVALSYTNGKLTSIQDPYGRTIGLTYNAPGGKMDTVTDPVGRVAQIGYDSNGYLASITDPMITDPVNNAWRYTYYSDGKLWTKTDPRGNTTIYEYNDPQGRITAATTSEGIKRISYVTGNSTTITERDGGIWTYSYSTNPTLPLQIVGPGDATTAYVYDTSGNVRSMTDSEGNETTYLYGFYPDGSIQTKSVTTDQTDPVNSTTTYTYNQWGQITNITDSLQNQTIYEYDPNGNLLRITDPLQNKTEMTYYGNGDLHTVTDANRKTTTYAYDTMGRLWTVTDPLQGVTSYSYNADDKLLTVTDANNHPITYGYEPLPPSGLGTIISMTDQLQNVESYGYDAYSNIQYLTNRKGERTRYDYDANNRLQTVTYEADNSSISFTYYPSGKVQMIADSVSGLITYEYYSGGCTSCSGGLAGKLKTETTPLGSIAYTYDTIGRRKSMTVAGQSTVNYTYGSNRQLQHINTMIGTSSATFGFTYDEIGRRKTIAFPNGVTTEYSLYDNASRLKTLRHLDPLQNVLESIGYTYDANGNRTSMDRASTNLPLLSAAANISYNNANQMLTFNDKNITYDADGNMQTVTNSCGMTTYTWDVRNRLVAIQGFDALCNVLSAAFKYEALGRRIEKTINGRTIKYLYDGGDTIQEIENGTPTVNYIRTLNIDEPSARIQSDGTVRYYHADALGSITSLTDDTGAIKTQYVYDPFGTVTVLGEASDNPFQYTGRENDETGLYYYRARYYNPELQRFISEDPIGLEGGINKYTIVENDPLNDSDPHGFSGRKKACDKIASELGGALGHGPKHLGEKKSMKPICSQIGKWLAKFDANNCSVYYEDLGQRARDFYNRHCECPDTGYPKNNWIGPVIGIGVVGTCLLCPECCGVVAPILGGVLR